MKLNVKKLEALFLKGVQALDERFHFIDECGRLLLAKKSHHQQLNVTLGDCIVIEYPHVAGFFRGLSFVLQEKEVSEVVQFDENGLMFDCSRNGVLNLSYAKTLIENLALFGLNTFFLYLEDTYELKEEPYFGHLRGRYTHDELKQLDEYAVQFGVELVPCIQTLAHLHQYFRWPHTQPLLDIEDILCVGNEEVYALIELMIKNLAACLRSSRIHVGMDEAYHLGRGDYLNQHGLQSKTHIMQQHLTRVNEILMRYDKKMMIWDDMFFKQYGETTTKTDVFDDLTLVYWDYYSTDEAHYDEALVKRLSVTKDVMFAGGAWRWHGFVPSHQFTYESTQSALKMCKKHQIKSVMVTSWGDDGAECLASMVLYGLALYGEHGYNHVMNVESFKSQLSFVSGIPYEAHVAIGNIIASPHAELRTNLDKQILYVDPLVPVTACHHQNLGEHLTCVREQLRPYEMYNEVALYAKLVDVLLLKWNLSANIKRRTISMIIIRYKKL